MRAPGGDRARRGSACRSRAPRSPAVVERAASASRSSQASTTSASRSSSPSTAARSAWPTTCARQRPASCCSPAPERVDAGDGAQGRRARPRSPSVPRRSGRVIDPLGRPLDGRDPLPDRALPLFRPAPELIERKSVEQPLLDRRAGDRRGDPDRQGAARARSIGDRNVGKTALAIDFVAAQRRGDVACVYVVIGQPLSRGPGACARRWRAWAASRTPRSSPQTPAPRPACDTSRPTPAPRSPSGSAIRGGDALIVYDDLTKHADAYRELALLLDRPPGREAFPATSSTSTPSCSSEPRRAARGGRRLGARPCRSIETTEGDIAAYIPTNVISITDGQIYLDTARFERDQRPAVDVGRSVSRIGGAAQPAALRRGARTADRACALRAARGAGARGPRARPGRGEGDPPRPCLARAAATEARPAALDVAAGTRAARARRRAGSTTWSRAAATRGQAGRRSRAGARARRVAALESGAIPAGRLDAASGRGRARPGCGCAAGARRMSEERSLGARLRTLATLHEAVGALRSLSAHHFRAVRAALPAARSYRLAVETHARCLARLAGGRAARGGRRTHRRRRRPRPVRRLLRPGRRGSGGGAPGARPGSSVLRRPAIRRPLERAGITLDRRYDAPVSARGLSLVLVPLVDDVVTADARVTSATWCWSRRASRARAASRSTRTRILPVAAPPGSRRSGASPTYGPSTSRPS